MSSHEIEIEIIAQISKFYSHMNHNAIPYYDINLFIQPIHLRALLKICADHDYEF